MRITKTHISHKDFGCFIMDHIKTCNKNNKKISPIEINFSPNQLKKKMLRNFINLVNKLLFLVKNNFGVRFNINPLLFI